MAPIGYRLRTQEQAVDTDATQFKLATRVVDEHLVGLGGSEVKVLIALARLANNPTRTCCVTHPTLARMTGMSRWTVMKAVDYLEERGLLTRERRQSGFGREANRYTLLEQADASVAL